MDLTIRPLVQADLPGAESVFRLAMGTLHGARDPEKYGRNIDYVRSRYQADPHAAYVAELSGKTVGSIFAAKWGSVAVVGPLTVDPDHWDRAIGTRLLEPTMDLINRWGCDHSGLHTVVHSAKHIRLYRKFGFWPRCLIEVMSKPVEETKTDDGLLLFSELPETEKSTALADCLRITESFYIGLDLSREISAVDVQQLGDTALLYDGDKLCGFAVCHFGAGTEAGPGRCYIKFAAVAKSPHSEACFVRMLKACEVLAASRGGSMVVAGTNTARNRACRAMIAHGYHTESVGVAMHRPYDRCYNRRDSFVIDDWR